MANFLTVYEGSDWRRLVQALTEIGTAMSTVANWISNRNMVPDITTLVNYFPAVSPPPNILNLVYVKTYYNTLLDTIADKVLNIAGWVSAAVAFKPNFMLNFADLIRNIIDDPGLVPEATNVVRFTRNIRFKNWQFVPGTGHVIYWWIPRSVPAPFLTTNNSPPLILDGINNIVVIPTGNPIPLTTRAILNLNPTNITSAHYYSGTSNFFRDLVLTMSVKGYINPLNNYRVNPLNIFSNNIGASPTDFDEYNDAVYVGFLIQHLDQLS